MTRVTQDGVTTDARFHRVNVEAGWSIAVAADAKPTAIWIPSGCEVVVMMSTSAVLDISEVVDHEDVVSMEKKLREMKKVELRAKAKERQARRRLRRGGRDTHHGTPDPDEL